MTVCQEYQEKMALAIFGDLDPADERALKSHMELCERCAEEYATMAAALQVVEETKPPRPAPATLDGLWEKLEPELDAVDARARGRTHRLLSSLRPEWGIEPRMPGWALPLAAALAVAVAVVFVSRIPSDRTQPIETQAAVDTDTQERVNAFLVRSEALVMGISNLDPRRIEPTGYVLSAERRAARELTREAEALRNDLTPGGDQRLVALVTDLEIIFLQVSNIRERRARADLEMVQVALERRGVLFAMSLEEMKRTKGATVVKSSV
jgi:hypothetical protein